MNSPCYCCCIIIIGDVINTMHYTVSILVWKRQVLTLRSAPITLISYILVFLSVLHIQVINLLHT